MPRAVHYRNFLILQIYHLVRVFNDGGGVRAQEKLRPPVGTFAQTYNQGASLPCAHQLVGMALVQYGNSIGSNHVFQSQLNSRIHVAVVCIHHIFHQLHQHLGVGLAAESHIVLLHLGAQRLVILNNAVVYKRQVLRLRVMGMRIYGIGFAVRGPTGVGNADCTRSVLLLDTFFKCRHLAFGFVHIQIPFGIDDGNSRTVVPTIFQTVQAFNQDRACLLFPEVSNDSTHIFVNILVLVYQKQQSNHHVAFLKNSNCKDTQKKQYNDFFVYKSFIQDNSIPALIPLQPVPTTSSIPFYLLGEQMLKRW